MSVGTLTWARFVIMTKYYGILLHLKRKTYYVKPSNLFNYCHRGSPVQLPPFRGVIGRYWLGFAIAF